MITDETGLDSTYIEFGYHKSMRSHWSRWTSQVNLLLSRVVQRVYLPIPSVRLHKIQQLRVHTALRGACEEMVEPVERVEGLEVAATKDQIWVGLNGGRAIKVLHHLILTN